MYGRGITRVGEIMEIALSNDIVAKSGAWFSFGDIRLGQGKENVKEIAYKGSNTVSIKNVTKKLNPASFKIDRQLVKQIKNVMIIAHPDDETLWLEIIL